MFCSVIVHKPILPRKAKTPRVTFHLFQFLLREAKQAARDAVFSGQIRFKNAGVIRIQCDEHARIEQTPDGVYLKRRHCAGTHVTGYADLERNLFVAQTADQIRIIDRPDTVSNPLRADRQRPAD